MKIGTRGLLSALLVLGCSWPWAVNAESGQRLDMEGTSIRGNEEQPKVLFVIPWKARESAPLPNEAPQIKAAPEIKPLERSEFRAGMYYRKNREIGDLL